jgi:hypothetical protein
VRYLVSGPAMDRLGWILDGLNGAVDWGSDAAEVLAPEFAALVPPEVFTERVRQRAAAFAPCAVTGLDTSDHAARARVRVRDGSVQVVTCTVEPAAPHRITGTRTMALIPSVWTPRLPADFTGYPELAGRGAGARLIVFSGLPGTGKSTLAQDTGRHLRAPVFAADWLLSESSYGRTSHACTDPKCRWAGRRWCGRGGTGRQACRWARLIPSGARRPGGRPAGGLRLRYHACVISA